MKKVASIVSIIVLYCLMASTVAEAQLDRSPVKWQFTAIPTSNKKATLVFTATLDDGWHIYSQFIEAGGPLPTTFTFLPDNRYALSGKVKEAGKPIKSYDSTFEMKIVWYSNVVTFSQEVTLEDPVTTIKGTIEFMSCTDETCLPPKEVPFTLEVRAVEDKKHKGK